MPQALRTFLAYLRHAPLSRVWAGRGPGVALVPRLPLATFFDPSGIGEEERGFMRRGGRLRSAAQRTERTTLLAHARVIHGTLKCWAASQWSDEWALLVSTA